MKIKIFLLIFLSFLAIECNKIEDFVDNTKNKNDKDKIDIATTQLIFNETKSNDVITFTATSEWSADLINDRAANWITISPKSGKSGQSKINISVSENSLYDDRSATIQIRCGSIKKDITIVQKQKDALTVTSSKFEIDAKGGSVNIEVKSNIDFNWDISNTSRSWIKYFGTKAIESHTLQFSISENTDISNREGEIILTGLTGNKLSETIKIYQFGEQPSIILTQDKYNVSDVESVIKVEIKSNVDVSVKIPDNVDWIKEDKDKSASTNTYYFTVAENNQGVERKTKISFKNEEFSIIKDIEIVQSSMPNIYVETAGNLPKLMREIDYDNVFRLKISGILNENDFDFLLKCSNLVYLDVSEIVNTTLPNGTWNSTNYFGYFNDLRQLEYIILPHNLTEIGIATFKDCGKLKSIEIPKSVTIIKKRAFEGCMRLESVIFDEESELKIIDGEYFNGAFTDCNNLKQIKIPKSVTRIGQSAFYSSGLQSITFEEDSQLVEICGGAGIHNGYAGAFGAFRSTDLEAITIPSKVKKIGAGAFEYCKKLKTINFENNSELEIIESISYRNGSYESWNGAFENCGSLESITIPSSVKTIGRYAFAFCDKLKIVRFENNSALQTIERNAFMSCTIELVDAYGCSDLNSISGAFSDVVVPLFLCGAVVPPAASGAFYTQTLKPRTLVVPDESVEQYKQSTSWSASFDNIIGFSEYEK